jgi:Pyruvate/2-oxoacid:ferredoxin oxidoreductase gamma subunit
VARRPVPAEGALCAELERDAGAVRFIDAMALLRQAGARASSINIVMLGALTALEQCPVESGELLEVIRDSTVPAQWEMNQRLFALGSLAVSG